MGLSKPGTQNRVMTKQKEPGYPRVLFREPPSPKKYSLAFLVSAWSVLLGKV